MSAPELNQLIERSFPLPGISLAFGYGSRVLKQGANSGESSLVDIILVIDDPLQWHEQNLKINYDHYSFLRYLPSPARRITDIQERFGAGIYYNPYIIAGGFALKYGVISTKQLIQDLSYWTKLYVAGRLHKPVEMIIDSSNQNEQLRRAIKDNRENAVRAAFLQLPETFGCLDLYRTIAGLSYHGDPRMLFGEDKNKIDKIVMNQIEKFDRLYHPIIRHNQSLKEMAQWNESKATFVQDKSPKILFKNLKLLPRDLRETICEAHGKKARAIEADVVLASVSRSINCDLIVSKSIAAIVRRSSISQSLKGILTAGITKSLKYSQRKLVKSLMSRFGWS